MNVTSWARLGFALVSLTLVVKVLNPELHFSHHSASKRVPPSRAVHFPFGTGKGDTDVAWAEDVLSHEPFHMERRVAMEESDSSKDGAGVAETAEDSAAADADVAWAEDELSEDAVSGARQLDQAEQDTWLDDRDGDQVVEEGEAEASTLNKSRDNPVAPSFQPPPLRVFMYELPSRYNFDMVSEAFEAKRQQKPGDDSVAFPEGLMRQHSVAFWLTADLVDSGSQQLTPSEISNRAAVRVFEESEAEVFFVPFFASLSYDLYATDDLGSLAEKDRQLQEGILQLVKAQPAYQRSQGHDHVFELHHPNAMAALRDQLATSVFVLADFGRYDKTVANLEKDVIAPYVHLVPTYNQDKGGWEDRPTLLFFQGKIQRKEEGRMRRWLVTVLSEEPDVRLVDHKATSDGVHAATEGMRQSKFCLHPAGDTPSSCRLFDAIASHCVPVVVSDRIELPFEDVLDYSHFAIFLSQEEALKPGHLVNLLRSVPRQRWEKMWQRLREVEHHFEYNHPATSEGAVSMIWMQIAAKVPSITQAIHRSRRLVNRGPVKTGKSLEKPLFKNGPEGGGQAKRGQVKRKPKRNKKGFKGRK